MFETMNQLEEVKPSREVITKEIPKSNGFILPANMEVSSFLTNEDSIHQNYLSKLRSHSDDEMDIFEDGIMSKPPTYETENTMNTEVIEKKNVEPYNTRALSKHAETYEIEKFHKNKLIIFNQVNVFGFQRRVGTERDVSALTKTFEKFKFEITVVTDATTEEILSRLDKLDTENFTDYGCIAVVILTYGAEGGRLRAKNPPLFTERDVLNRVMNKNPTLITKPRIVIFQASRGENHLAGMREEQYSDKVYEDREEQFYTLPVEADLLVIHSSFPGKDSHRTLSGSWFIQTLCSKINDLADKQDLESILVEVKRSVALKEAPRYNKFDDVMEVSKQMPVITSTLIRKLYLRGYPDNMTAMSTREKIIDLSLGSMLTPRLLMMQQSRSRAGNDLFAMGRNKSPTWQNKTRLKDTDTA